MPTRTCDLFLKRLDSAPGSLCPAYGYPATQERIALGEWWEERYFACTHFMVHLLNQICRSARDFVQPCCDTAFCSARGTDAV